MTTKATFGKFSRFQHKVPHAQELKLDKLAPDMAILVGAGDSPTGLAFLWLKKCPWKDLIELMKALYKQFKTVVGGW